MLYKCNHCNYLTKRKCDLLRHEKKKNSCNKRLEVEPCNVKVEENVNAVKENVNAVKENVNAVQENVNAVQENVNVVKENDNAGPQKINVDPQKINVVEENDNGFNTNSKIFCDKCNKDFSSKQVLKAHLLKCDGLDPKQCKICLKLFSTRQGKSQHTRYVKCSPPAASTGPTHQTINNIDNSITNNTTNINNTINLNFRGNFDAISKNDIANIVKQLEKSEYIKMISDNMKSGKYAVPRTIEHIYFNDDFPTMQTLKKERRNDKMVEVHVDGKWEKRLVDDILRKLIVKVEEYHSEYFKHLQEKYKDVPIGSTKWNQLVRPIKNFGHMMLWYDGFKGEDIERIGIELNSPDDEKAKKAKNKDMVKIIKEKVYENTSIEKEKWRIFS